MNDSGADKNTLIHGGQHQPDMRCEVRDSHGRLTVLRGHGVHRLQQITATHNNNK